MRKRECFDYVVLFEPSWSTQDKQEYRGKAERIGHITKEIKRKYPDAHLFLVVSKVVIGDSNG